MNASNEWSTSQAAKATICRIVYRHRIPLNTLCYYMPILHTRLFVTLTTRQSRIVNMNTIKLLDIRPGSQILEIGFGFGDTSIRLCLKYLGTSHNEGCYHGLEKNDLMVLHASDEYRDQINKGRVVIKEGSPDQNLNEYEANYFDVCFGVYVFWFLQERRTSLLEIHRVLKQNGRCVFAVRVYGQSKLTRGSAAERVDLNALEEEFREVGFETHFRWEVGWSISDTLYIIAHKQ